VLFPPSQIFLAAVPTIVVIATSAGKWLSLSLSSAHAPD
jgi:hypothetical protein